ncbi:MAG: HD domain-containing protein [Deltaproteobacteria bacterium]|nr:HD domain-containing protein [Deltaproteobacteria bacterium]
MKTNIFGVVDIGAGSIRCQISEISKNSYAERRIRILEYIVFPLSIGEDTFLKKYITLDTVYKAAEIFKKIKLKFKEYDINGNYKAVCTSAVRDAENKHFFINHIRVKTGIELEIIDAEEELYIKYLGVSETLKGFKKLESKGVVLVNLSSGNVGINIRKNKISLFSSTLPYGALRIAQLFSDIEEKIKYRAYEQYINKLVLLLKKSRFEYDKINSVIGSDTSTGLLLEIFKPEENFFDIIDLANLYFRIKTVSASQISGELSINEYEAKIIKPVLYVYISIMKSVGAKKLYFSDQNFSDQLTRFYLAKTKEKKFNKKLIEYFFYYGKRYNLDEKHAKQVLIFSEKIRRSLKNILNVKPDERTALIGAAILHDVGYYTNINDHHEYSNKIIHSLNIPGLDREILENIGFCSLFHGSGERRALDAAYYKLSPERELTIKKIISILKIADALDASHMQLIKDITLEALDKLIKVTVVSSVTPFLEIKHFKLKSKDFLETFGIPIELCVKLDYE